MALALTRRICNSNARLRQSGAPPSVERQYPNDQLLSVVRADCDLVRRHGEAAHFAAPVTGIRIGPVHYGREQLLRGIVLTLVFDSDVLPSGADGRGRLIGRWPRFH